MRLAIVTTAFLSLCFIASAAVLGADKPTVQKTYPHRLSNKETTELAELVCRARHGVNHHKIEAWISSPRDKNVHASIGCLPHATTDNYAIFYKAECLRGDRWQCKRSETWLRATLDTRQVDIATNGYNPEIAYSLVSKIASYRNIKGDLVFGPDTKHCALSKGPSRELLDITCDGKNYRLSYWCPKSSCPRIFSINDYFVPADSGGL